jgi:MEKHLA domain
VKLACTREMQFEFDVNTIRRPIIEGEPEIADVARLLFEAPFAVLAHNAAEEPTFTYANQVISGCDHHLI